MDPGYESVPYSQRGPPEPAYARPEVDFPARGGQFAGSGTQYTETGFSRDPGYEVLPGENKVNTIDIHYTRINADAYSVLSLWSKVNNNRLVNKELGKVITQFAY